MKITSDIWNLNTVATCTAIIFGIYVVAKSKDVKFFVFGSRKKTKTDSLNNFTVDKLKNSNWTKVGTIKELYFYPLKSGKAKSLEKCCFTEYGISLKEDGLANLRDRMFLVVDEATGHFRTGRNHPSLVLVSITAVSETHVELKAEGMPQMTFRVPEHRRSRDFKFSECFMWWGESVEGIDCGNDVAEWISRFLIGKNEGLRLLCASLRHRDIMNGPWERFVKVYKTLRNEDTGLFSDLASYMLMTTQSLDELNKRLDKTVPMVQFRPNIVVSTEQAFSEDNWEWIRIGESVVIRNVKPCPRCTMTRVDPSTGKMDKEEPLKTLRQFREQTNPERIAVDGKAPLMGIYCGSYFTGNVSVGDDVFVYKVRA